MELSRNGRAPVKEPPATYTALLYATINEALASGTIGAIPPLLFSDAKLALDDLAARQTPDGPTQPRSPSAADDEGGDLRRPLPRFPLSALPDPLRDLAEEAEANGAFPADFVAVHGLPVLAAGAGGRWQLAVEPGWIERGILWSAVVAGVGEGKSPAWRAAIAPLVEADRAASAAHSTALAEWDERCASLPRAQRTPRPPVAHRLLVGDATMERLIGILAENPHGILLASDELRGVIAGLNQYKGGRGADRTHLLALWNGDDVTMDRVGSAADGRIVRVQHPALCLTGGIQPAMLSALDGEDGLAPRFLLAYASSETPDPTGAGIRSTTSDAWKRLVGGLVENRPDRLTTITLSAAAADRMLGLRQATRAARGTPASPHVLEFRNKLPGHVARIALVLAVARLTQEGGNVREVASADVAAALAIGDYFLAHADGVPLRRVNLAASPHEQRLDEGVAHLAAWLRTRPEGAPRRDIQGCHVAGARTPEDVDRLLSRFEQTYPSCVTGDGRGRRYVAP